MSDQVTRIRSILDATDLPAFISGYSLRTGEFADEPAIWITFQTLADGPARLPFPPDRLRAMNNLVENVRSAVLDDYDVPYPYFRFADESPTPAP